MSATDPPQLPDTMVVTLQNGVEATDMVARRIGREHVAGGGAYFLWAALRAAV